MKTLLTTITIISVLFSSCKKDTSSTNSVKHTIGESFQGGIIAYVDATGQHGFIASTEDYGASSGTTVKWSTSDVNVGSISTAIGSGKSNTDAMANNNCYSAIRAKSYAMNGYTDWYLPSRGELAQMYKAKNDIGGFVSKGIYWSSSEIDLTDAWVVDFSDGSYTYGDKQDYNYLRFIRAF